MGDLTIVTEFPKSWQSLWEKTHTVQCMTCGHTRPFRLLLSISAALAAPCPKCGGWDLIGYDPAGNRASLRCGAGHGSTIATIGCMHLRDYVVAGKPFAPPLYVPISDQPVLCHDCEVSRRQSGRWDIDRLGSYCLFCMGGIIREARRNQIPIRVIDLTDAGEMEEVP